MRRTSLRRPKGSGMVRPLAWGLGGMMGMSVLRGRPCARGTLARRSCSSCCCSRSCICAWCAAPLRSVRSAKGCGCVSSFCSDAGLLGLRQGVAP
jgi:hypothetical protein